MSEKISDSFLCDQQKKVLSTALDGHNIFFTGSAGTGKTRLLGCIVEQLSEKHGRNGVGITATTGIAALQVGGQTLHSWAGIGLGKGSRYKILQQVLSNEDARLRWINCQSLVIDEISMLDQETFETLEFLGRKVRNNKYSFGGLQIILCGDFQQLPPVISLKYDEQLINSSGNIDFPYCFRSPKWDASIQLSMKLTEIFRQNDSTLLTLLEEVREGGTLSSTAHDILKTVETEEINHHSSVYLFPLRKDVIAKNYEKLTELNGKEFVSRATDTGKKDSLKDCSLAEVFIYKIGARVMLLRNMHEKGLANGSMGTVVSVANEKPLITFDSGLTTTIAKLVWSVKNEDGVIIATRRQLPLELSWAVTIHKSQGQTLPNVAISLKGMFAYGQAYVALSRATSLQGLSVYPNWDHHIPKTPTYLKAFQDAILPADSCDLKPTERSCSDTASNEDNSLPQSGHFAAEFDWSSNLSLPSFINIEDILREIEDRHGRSSQHKLLCQRVRESLSQSSTLLKISAYCWDKLEDIYIANGEATAIEIQELVSKKNMEETTKKFLALQRSEELKERMLSVFKEMGIASVEQRLLSIFESTFLFDLLIIL
eukprot:Seg2809.2 transcript_id=Seg2809.2/GoldUCD/mRNA.D3Y31 product="ATP-dependent DNA helicase PIF1" protein_id=Seg2809.2/GoldUCD/D3Y31